TTPASLIFLHRRASPSFPPPLPYTTLFRSDPQARRQQRQGATSEYRRSAPWRHRERARGLRRLHPRLPVRRRLRQGADLQDGPRSEEHTSELQSRENLVCRLLLEKKNPLA